VEFDKTILANWILSGYRLVEYRPTSDHGIVSPLAFDGIPSDESYVLDISDPQILEMANGIDEFKIITHVLP
jgi:hypothetical protein